MFNHRTGLSATVCTLALLFAGCSSTKLDEEAPVESRNPVPAAGTGAGAGGATGSGTSQSGVATVDLNKSGAGGADAAAMAQRTVYFDFDSFIVKDEYRPMLEAHAKVLSANRSKRLVLEGHTDEHAPHGVAIDLRVRLLCLSGRMGSFPFAQAPDQLVAPDES